jgi:SAM-dependent methyltransferase
MRWGLAPSLTAHLALTEIGGVYRPGCSLLDVGCGYGRDLLLFRTIFPALILDGIEPSRSAFVVADALMHSIRFRNAFNTDVFSFFDSKPGLKYDVIFANYFIHLFSIDEAVLILKQLHQFLNVRGLLVMSFISTRDPHHGLGMQISSHFFEVYPKIPWRFYTPKDACAVMEKCAYRVKAFTEYKEVELLNGQPDKVHGFYIVMGV